jgi:hypothetical protein
VTGANCEKRVDPDYDLRFLLASSSQPARAGLGIPFRLASASFSLSLWVRFEGRIGQHGNDGQMSGGMGQQQQQQPNTPSIFFSLFDSGLAVK